MQFNVWAVIVTYYPDPGFSERVARIHQQVRGTVIVDNSASATLNRSQLAQCGITVLENSKNLGIARALNQGCEYALSQGAQFVVTLDQDSEPPSDFVAALLNVALLYRRDLCIGIVAPQLRDIEAGVDYSGEGVTEVAVVDTVITSGNLLSLEAWLNVGGFRDSLFIDYVDHEFCLRLARYGYCVIQTPTVVLAHRLGKMRVRSFGKWTLWSTNHAPRRRFYMARNRLRVYALYAFSNPKWVLKDLERSLKDLIVIGIVEKRRPAQFIAICAGLLSGLLWAVFDVFSTMTRGKPKRIRQQA